MHQLEDKTDLSITSIMGAVSLLLSLLFKSEYLELQIQVRAAY